MKFKYKAIFNPGYDLYLQTLEVTDNDVIIIIWIFGRTPQNIPTFPQRRL